jgi:hypothetical protein
VAAAPVAGEMKGEREEERKKTVVYVIQGLGAKIYGGKACAKIYGAKAWRQ